MSAIQAAASHTTRLIKAPPPAHPVQIFFRAQSAGEISINDLFNAGKVLSHRHYADVFRRYAIELVRSLVMQCATNLKATTLQDFFDLSMSNVLKGLPSENALNALARPAAFHKEFVLVVSSRSKAVMIAFQSPPLDVRAELWL